MPTTVMRVAHRVVGRAIVRWTRVTVTGLEHVPAHGGVLLAANHRSFLDHYLLGAVSPRPMWYLGKRELAVGVVGWINTTFGMVPVDRGHADLEAIARIVELLRAGEIVGVFPEGTRSPTGELFRFRSGMARIAAQAQVPVVPVGLINTAVVWPRRQMPHLRRPVPGLLQVRFAPALPPPPDEGPARRAFTAEVHAVVADLCGQPLADRFAPIPRD